MEILERPRTRLATIGERGLSRDEIKKEFIGCAASPALSQLTDQYSRSVVGLQRPRAALPQEVTA